MSVLKIKNVVMGFPALATPQSIGDGDPAYGARFIIDPSDTALVKQLDDAMLDAARVKWKSDAEAILSALIDDRKVAFNHRPYIQKKTMKPYAGWEGKFDLGTRTPVNRERPSVFAKDGTPLVADGNMIATVSEIERVLYSGCRVTAKIEFWAQDNSFGRRLNCTLLGVIFAGDGDRFGGGAGAASADDFADDVEEAASEAADLL